MNEISFSVDEEKNIIEQIQTAFLENSCQPAEFDRKNGYNSSFMRGDTKIYFGVNFLSRPGEFSFSEPINIYYVWVSWDNNFWSKKYDGVWIFTLFWGKVTNSLVDSYNNNSIENKKTLFD